MREEHEEAEDKMREEYEKRVEKVKKEWKEVLKDKVEVMNKEMYDYTKEC